MIAASEDDWDGYESLHWRAFERWLAANPDDPGVHQIREWHERHKRLYLRHAKTLRGREVLR